MTMSAASEFTRSTAFSNLPDREFSEENYERAASAARNAFMGLIFDCYGAKPDNITEWVQNMQVGAHRFEGQKAEFVGEYSAALEAGQGLLQEAIEEQMLPDEAEGLGLLLGTLEPRDSLVAPALLCAATRYAIVFEAEQKSGEWR